MGWFEACEMTLIDFDLVLDAMEKVNLIKETLKHPKVAKSRIPILGEESLTST